MKHEITKLKSDTRSRVKGSSSLKRVQLKEFSKLNPWRTNRAILIEWLAIISVIYLCATFFSPFLYIVSLMWIGARQHALAVLMHEGVHNRISHNRLLNDSVAEILLAWPLFITMRGFRKHHLAHHQYTNQQNDPDWVRKSGINWEFPMKKPHLAWLLFQDMIGLNFKSHLSMILVMSQFDLSKNGKVSSEEIKFHIARFIFYFFTLVILIASHTLTLFFLYWLAPLFTWFIMTMRIRSIAEHHAVEYSHLYSHTRTTVPNLFDQLFLVPRNISFHIEHHLYPNIPFFELPTVHYFLMNSDSEYRENAHISKGYFKVLQECCSGKY